MSLMKKIRETKKLRMVSGAAGLSLCLLFPGCDGITSDEAANVLFTGLGTVHTLSEIDENFSTAERNRAWIDIQRERQRQQYGPRITARFTKVDSEHNINTDGTYGMNLVSSFNVWGGQGCPLTLSAYFYHKNGTKLRDFDGDYCTRDGQIAVSEDISPPYENAVFNNFRLFIPYGQLHCDARGDYSLKFNLCLWDCTKNPPIKLCVSPYVNFVWSDNK